MPAAPRPTSADMEPWYEVATPRKGVREGRSFNPKGSEEKRLRDAMLLAVPG